MKRTNPIDYLDLAYRKFELAWTECSEVWRDQHASSFLKNVHEIGLNQASHLRQLLLDLDNHEQELQRAEEDFND